MELVFTTLAIIAGMSFSLAVALLVEELIFGKVFRLFFAPRTSPAKSGSLALGRGLASHLAGKRGQY